MKNECSAIHASQTRRNENIESYPSVSRNGGRLQALIGGVYFSSYLYSMNGINVPDNGVTESSKLQRQYLDLQSLATPQFFIKESKS